MVLPRPSVSDQSVTPVAAEPTAPRSPNPIAKSAPARSSLFAPRPSSASRIMASVHAPTGMSVRTGWTGCPSHVPCSAFLMVRPASPGKRLRIVLEIGSAAASSHSCFAIVSKMISLLMRGWTRKSDARLALMLAAEVRRSAKHDRALDRAAAARTAIPFLAMLREPTSRVIAATRLERDRLFQHASQAGEDRLHLRIGERIDRAARVNGCAIQRLVDVQVAHPGDDLLRHQQRLHRTAAAAHDAPKQRQTKCGTDRIGTEAMLGDERVRIGRDVDDAEEPHVVVREPGAALEFEDDARESRLIVVIEIVKKIATHAEVQVQPRWAGIREEMLAMTPNLRERASHHRPLQRRSAHAKDPLIEHAY